MKHLRKTETSHNPFLLIVFTAVTILVIGVAIVISACAESYLEPNTVEETISSTQVEVTTCVATSDTATKDEETTNSTESEPTLTPATEVPTEELVEPTEIEDTEEYREYGEQSYEVDPADYEVVESDEDETYNYFGDTDLLAKVIYLEAGDCSEYCQWLVGSTAMNLADEYGSLSAVAYNYNIFNVSYQLDSCEPSSLSYSVAERILSGDRDYNVKAFRDGCYHSFGTPYESVDGVYFSTY